MDLGAFELLDPIGTIGGTGIARDSSILPQPDGSHRLCSMGR